MVPQKILLHQRDRKDFGGGARNRFAHSHNSAHRPQKVRMHVTRLRALFDLTRHAPTLQRSPSKIRLECSLRTRGCDQWPPCSAMRGVAANHCKDSVTSTRSQRFQGDARNRFAHSRNSAHRPQKVRMHVTRLRALFDLTSHAPTLQRPPSKIRLECSLCTRGCDQWSPCSTMRGVAANHCKDSVTSARSQRFRRRCTKPFCALSQFCSQAPKSQNARNPLTRPFRSHAPRAHPPTSPLQNKTRMLTAHTWM